MKCFYKVHNLPENARAPRAHRAPAPITQGRETDPKGVAGVGGGGPPGALVWWQPESYRYWLRPLSVHLVCFQHLVVKLKYLAMESTPAQGPCACSMETVFSASSVFHMQVVTP